jgi:hypothetical protein
MKQIDPIKKADLIRDMVVSFKIPDRFNVRFIFRNVYQLWIFQTGSINTLNNCFKKSTTEVGKSKGRIQHVRNCKSENPAAAEKLMFLSFRTKK